MKRIALALILALGAAIAQADEYRYCGLRFYSFSRSVGAERRMGSSPPGEGSQRHRLCAALQVAMVLLLQGPRTTHFATGLCGFNANDAASAWLLLRTRQWCIYARSERGHCTASKELVDARYGNTYRSRTARVAPALIKYGGRSCPTLRKILQ